MNFRCIVFLCLPIFFLLACAHTPPASQIFTRPAQAELSSFVISGRIAIKHNGQRTSATMRWTHGAGADEILLFAPLGQTVARINRDNQGVTLDTSDKHYTALSTEELTQQVLGWSMPLSGLQYWALAVPSPLGEYSVERDASSQITALYQDGWAINYTHYATPAQDSLPLRLTLQRADLEIRLLIDQWEIPSQH